MARPLPLWILVLSALVAAPIARAGESDWKQVNRLIGDWKLSAAAKLVEARLAGAKKRGDQAEWTRALVKLAQIRIDLSSYEAAVRLLKEEPWPKDPIQRAILELYYGHALAEYCDANEWEIRERERVASKGPVDLNAWTYDQIRAEVERAYANAWAAREALGSMPVGEMAEYLDPGSYPAEVRGTMRDAVTYLLVGVLASSDAWTPDQENDVYLLDAGALVRGDPAKSHTIDVGDRAVHPLVRIGAALDDLEAWHAAAGRKAATLEARLERGALLAEHLTDAGDQARIRGDLEERIESFRDVSWYSMGKAKLAELWDETHDEGGSLHANRLAHEGYEAYPTSPGGLRCQALFTELEAPSFSLESMLSDGLGERSIRIEHKNLPVLYLRAYPLDLDIRLARKGHSLLPEHDELRRLMAERQPVAQWSAKLPPTPDFALHATYLTPPLESYGAYVIVASVREDFRQKDNRLEATPLILSPFAIVSQTDDRGATEVRVVDGQTGEPVAGASVDYVQFERSTWKRKVRTVQTDASGYARFGPRDESTGRDYLVARKGKQRAYDFEGLQFIRPEPQKKERATLIYTDRSIYRPLQKVRWKVVAYEGLQPHYRTLPEATVTVSLADDNGQTVESRKVRTNKFGSASGEFLIPNGHLLGSWTLKANPSGTAWIQVEEYKRPTFEATFRDPEAPMRLNRPVTMTGEARYYFGLPVANGTVRWRVTREPRYAWWWEGRHEGQTTVATGSAALRPDGTFQLAFTPQANERDAQDGITYVYAASADVTDEGGETRTAERSTEIGFSAVDVSIRTGTRFWLDRGESEVQFLRTDLDGNRRPGRGRWWLTALRQPSDVLLPSDEPLSEPAGAGMTPGDRLRPRWTGSYSPGRTLRRWEDGERMAGGEVTHDSRGDARARVPKLAPGAYRIHYETVDEFGMPFRTSGEIVVTGASTRLALPLALIAEHGSVPVGGTVRALVTSGIADLPAVLEIRRQDRPVERRFVAPGKNPELLELPVTAEDRGGIDIRLWAIRDYQLLQLESRVAVPFDDRKLELAFETFRDRLRPGSTETFRVRVKAPPGQADQATIELLAYMYDRSLDFFVEHAPVNALGLYRQRYFTRRLVSNLEAGRATTLSHFTSRPAMPGFEEARLKGLEEYAIGIGRIGTRGFGAGGGGYGSGAGVIGGMKAEEKLSVDLGVEESPQKGPPPAREQVRSNFSETAFFQPHLLADANGVATIELTVPDSVTSWALWVHALTQDLAAGSIAKQVRTVKELMVRPYLPRFLREGDEATLEVVLNNAAERKLQGDVALDIIDLETNQSVLADFGVKAASLPFAVKAQNAAKVTYSIRAPRRVRPYAFKVVARAGDESDGEQRPLPVLPSRLRLTQSRFATLHDADSKVLRFADLAAGADPSLKTEQIVVTVDAQLFYTALQALPYLVSYPYECTEQTLNRFVSTGILSSLYSRYPDVAKAAKEMSKRETQLEAFDAPDANRRMLLEESPWLRESKGGSAESKDLLNVLDPRVAAVQRETALAKLDQMQEEDGAFPWFPGGPPSPYMTLHALAGLARAKEYGVEVPRDLVEQAWGYVGQHYARHLAPELDKKNPCCLELFTYVGYVASSFPDEKYLGGALSLAQRRKILDFSFKHWREQSPYLKGMLALTLKRMGRPADARKVFESVMDSAKTTEEQGTFWAPEDRSWLWYNDTTESHAFALRVLMELAPRDARRHGLVQWLLLDKKLSHWKSTRATAEVLYALVKYLEVEGALGVAEEIRVTVGPTPVDLKFTPQEFTGRKSQIVLASDEVDPRRDSEIRVEKATKGFAFASATWSFATDQLPKEDRGDFFQVSRRYFVRDSSGKEVALRPLAEGERIRVGDEVEIQLSIRAKHEAEYVHLMDPRPAGLEPDRGLSGYNWDLGIAAYEEIRDSATSFFFDWVPAGEYTFKYRLRANVAGTFRVGPATLQSLYAPEFNAYSAGADIQIR